MTPLDPNDTEGRLRDATTAFTDTVEPATDSWALLRERVDDGGRRQRSRTIGAAVVGALVAAAVVAAMFVAGGSDGDVVVETPPATDGPTTPTEPGPSTTSPAPTSPVAGADVVYSTTDGRVLARTASGDVEVVSEPELDGFVVDSLQVAPDGTLWRLTKRAGEYCGIVDRIGSGGPASRPSFEAAHFAISPDGTELAYSTAGSGGGDGLSCEYEGAADAPEAVPNARVAIMDLSTGFERTVLTHDVDAEGYPLLPGRLAWSLDGSRLAVERCWEDCDVVVVDPASEGRLVEPDGYVGTAPAWLADGRLYLADGPFNSGGPEATGQSVVTAIDLDTGDEETIADAGDMPIEGLWNDPAGERLLVVIDGTLTMRGGPNPGQVDIDVVAATFGPGAPSAQCDLGEEPRPRAGSTAVQVWFFCPDAGLSDSPLIPVWRVVEGTDPESIVDGALQALFDGPTAAEQERGFGSGIPEEIWGANVDATLTEGTVSFDVDHDLGSVNNLSTSNMSLRWWYAVGSTVFAIEGVETLDPSGACVGEFDCTRPFMPDLLDEANLADRAGD